MTAFRHAQAVQAPPRRLEEVRVTAFGADVAVVTVAFVPDGDTRVGRQSQVWIRRPEGWRVASAHVSWEGASPT